MVLYAVILFLIAAVGGLVMAARIFQGFFPPAALAITHGGFAATGLVLAILAAATSGAPDMVKYGAGILFVAALGGFFLLSFHIRKAPHPKAVVAIHALAAVAGVVCLGLTLLK